MRLITNAANLTKEEADAIAALTLAVSRVARLDLVATVEQEPFPPLAMGRYSPTVTVRRAVDHNAEAAKRGGYSA